MTSKKPRELIYAALRGHVAVMQEMLRKGGGTATFESEKKAYAYRHACYRARKMVREAARELSMPGQIPECIYDDLYILIDKNVLTFKLRSKEPQPELSFKDEEDDFERALQEAANALKSKL